MYDLLVVGLGVYGSAVAAEAADRGLSVLAVDQFVPPHNVGSSGGASRVFRLTTVEGDEYCARARRAMDLWKAYDADTGGSLIVPMGLAIISEHEAGTQTHHGVDRLVARATRMAARHSIPHELLSGTEFGHRHPQLRLNPDDQVFYEPGAFILKPAVAIAAMLARIERSSKVDVLTGTVVKELRSVAGGVRATMPDHSIRARAAILCTGPWQTEKLLGRTVVPAVVRPQVSLRIPVPPTKSRPEVPALVHIAESGPLTYYVPAAPGLDEAKVGIEQAKEAIARPDKRLIRSSFVEDMNEQIRRSTKRFLPELKLDGAEIGTCYYTITPGSRHTMKYADADSRILIVAACSGHGFKFAPAVAEEAVASVRSRVH